MALGWEYVKTSKQILTFAVTFFRYFRITINNHKVSSKKSLLFPAILLLLTAALLLVVGRKDTPSPCAQMPCEKIPNCCLQKTPSEESANPHPAISNFILQI